MALRSRKFKSPLTPKQLACQSFLKRESQNNSTLPTRAQICDERGEWSSDPHIGPVSNSGHKDKVFTTDGNQIDSVPDSATVSCTPGKP